MHRPAARLGLCLTALTLAACSAASGAPTPRATTTYSPAPPSVATTSTPPATSSTTLPVATHPVVLGLGDSVTAGSNCGCTDFITAYAAQLPASANGPGQADNEGQDGLTAAQLAGNLSSGALHANLVRADIVIITIGANDLVPLIAQWSAGQCDTACGQAATLPVGASVGQILDVVHKETKPSTKVVVTDYWNVFEDGDVARQLHGDAFLDWSDPVTIALNGQLQAQAAAHGDQFVDLYAPFKGTADDRDPTDLLAPDGDHPNAAGEALITRVLLAATT